MRTHYDILGITPKANAGDIRTAFRRLAKDFHPDKTPDANSAVRRLIEDKFKEIQEAYDTLKSPAKRAEYDALLEQLRSPEYYEPSPQPPEPSGPTVTFSVKPSTVERGKLVTLTWSAGSATELRLRLGLQEEKIPLQGQRSVDLRQSTTLILTATGPGGTQSATARVTVIDPPPPPPPPPPLRGPEPLHVLRWILVALVCLLGYALVRLVRQSPGDKIAADFRSAFNSVRSTAPNSFLHPVQPSDAQIVTDIKAALYHDEILRNDPINIYSHAGRVTLHGWVRSKWERVRAIRLASEQPGVKVLRPELVVSPAARSLGDQRLYAQDTQFFRIRDPVIRAGTTSLTFPPVRALFLYGMATGGALPSGGFAAGQCAHVADASGQLAAALAATSSHANSFTTQTGFYVIGGLSVSGFRRVWASYASNGTRGAAVAVDGFTLSRSSWVVIIGLASSQQSIRLSGIPGLKTDAVSSGPDATEGMVIAHAYLPAGTYRATIYSSALAAGQDPDHMADLIGVFVFQ